jgi:hypothetical protein
LAILPQFSNQLSDDKFTAAQWLAKVINHKEGTQWNDAQTITHVRNTSEDHYLIVSTAFKH